MFTQCFPLFYRIQYGWFRSCGTRLMHSCDTKNGKDLSRRLLDLESALEYLIALWTGGNALVLTYQGCRPQLHGRRYSALYGYQSGDSCAPKTFKIV